jgi:hypothetical protein
MLQEELEENCPYIKKNIKLGNGRVSTGFQFYL